MSTSDEQKTPGRSSQAPADESGNLDAATAPPAASAAWRPPAATPALGTAPQGRPAQPTAAEDEATARHAALRPTPVPPGPATTPTTPPPSGLPQRRPTTAATPPGAPPAGAVATGGTGLGSGAVGATPGTAPGTAATEANEVPPPAAPASVTRTPSPDLFPDPNAPRTITVGTHALGTVVGILLPLVSALVTVLGISRIVAVEADGWVAKVDVLGIVLVTLGALLLLACALLSLWTPAVGLVGGALLTAAGGFALFAPGLARTGVLDVLSSEGWQPTVVQSVVVATSGTLVAIGVLVLGSGIVSSAARRHGIHLGAFRERHRTA